jgi:hypothetical protein
MASEMKMNFRNLIMNTRPLMVDIKEQVETNADDVVVLKGDDARRLIQFYTECSYVCSNMQ